MANKWDIDNVRKLAGLPLMESRWDNDDDDEYDDPDVRIAMGDKRQREFEKKNKGELDANAEMMRKRTAEQRAAAKQKAEAKKAGKEEPKADAKKADAKKDEPAKKEPPKSAPKEDPKADAKKDEPVKKEPAGEEKQAEAKRRGKAPNENSKAQRGAAWIRSNPSARRGEFLKWANENLQMTAAYASALFARVNPKSGRAKPVSECFVITHPHMSSFLLAENRELNQMQWIDPSSPLEPLVYESQAEAEKMVKYMSEWKNQAAHIEHVKFED